MNIIFEGDWVKVLGKWRQVHEVLPNDFFKVLMPESDEFKFATWQADSPAVEFVVSDLEMQEKLEFLSQ